MARGATSLLTSTKQPLSPSGPPRLRPGITGLAQVSGRNAISWERKFELDVEYVDRCSLALDLKILALTAWRVVARQGISQPGHATAEEFMGTPGR